MTTTVDARFLNRRGDIHFLIKKGDIHMKTSKAFMTITFALLLATITVSSTMAQGHNSGPRTDTKMLYHGGRIVTGVPNVYMIWYGCWGTTCGNWGSPTVQIDLITLVSNLGSSPYFQINTTYPNPNSPDQVPTGALFFGGSSVDRAYSQGVDLTDADLAAIVSNQVLSSGLPLDPSGLYIIVGSADVAANSIGFCSPGAPPHHGTSTVLGSEFRYGFIGHPSRCPSVAGAQFMAANGTMLPTPNNDFAADAMASDFAHLVSTMITDPYGNGWYDRYGLENADKCQGVFGPTYTVANGAQANVHLEYRDYLIQENWVNDKKGRCAMHL
jgi:hypothetical protein